MTVKWITVYYIIVNFLEQVIFNLFNINEFVVNYGTESQLSVVLLGTQFTSDYQFYLLHIKRS